MSSLFDDVGFVAVVLQGFGFIAQSVLVGSTVFVLLVVPHAPTGEGIGSIVAPAVRVVRAAAGATVALTLVSALLTGALLAATLDLAWRDVLGATFVTAAAVKVAAALVIAWTSWRKRRLGVPAAVASLAALAALLGAAVVDSHAFARVDHATPLRLATFAHELGAGVWLGGLPCLWLALRRGQPTLARRIGRRYSVAAATGVVLIVGAAAVFAVDYLGSVDAVYGTAYGAMAGVKTLLLALLLALGAANFRALRRDAAASTQVSRVRRFVEVEMAVGFAVLMAAASITTAPIAADVTADRVSLPELGARFAPVVPTFASPDRDALSPVAAGPAGAERARTDGDRAWSDYNHHVAGLAVALMGVAAFAQRRGGTRVAAHWPVLILMLGAFLLVRADPEVWPLGAIGPIASLRDPEVLQHRLFVALIAAFAIVEWRVQREREAAPRLARMFPILMVVGGALLLTHSHAIADAKSQLLIEMSHLAIAVLGVVAGSARWLELSMDGRAGRIAGFVWPAALIVVGLILLDYREA